MAQEIKRGDLVIQNFKDTSRWAFGEVIKIDSGQFVIRITEEWLDHGNAKDPTAKVWKMSPNFGLRPLPSPKKLGQ